MVFFYRHDEDGFTPTGLARSPWDPGKQNGVGLGGLLSHLIDGIAMPVPMATARLVIDILSAAPFAPLTARTEVLREGRRMQHVQAELLAEGRVVARATALRVREAETPPVLPPNPYPAPEDVESRPFMDWNSFGTSLEARPLQGGLGEIGPGALWVRFGHEHVEGVPLTPLVRVGMLADFGSGVSSMLSVKQWTFANLDISLHMTRLPVGEWLLIDAETISAGNGLALVSTVMADRLGPFARTHQSLFVNARG